VAERTPPEAPEEAAEAAGRKGCGGAGEEPPSAAAAARLRGRGAGAPRCRGGAQAGGAAARLAGGMLGQLALCGRERLV